MIESSETLKGSVKATQTLKGNIKSGGSSNYELPIASADTLGGIKVGENLTIDEDGTLNAVVGGSSEEIYSTEETIIGKWIDGKTLYRKVIDFGYLPNATSKSVPSNISNFDALINLSGIAFHEGAFIVLPVVNSNNLSASTSVYYDKSDDTIVILTGIDRSGLRAYITLEYTKTTD